MKDRQSITDIFDLHIIGDDIALEARLERFTKLRLGIDQKIIRRGGKENMGIHLALCAQDASRERSGLGRLASVVRYLSVEETKAILSRDAKLCVAGELEKVAFPCTHPQHHFLGATACSLEIGRASC